MFVTALTDIVFDEVVNKIDVLLGQFVSAVPPIQLVEQHTV